MNTESIAAETPTLEIKEAYRNYVPPVDAAGLVKQLLGAVPGKYLTGLDCIVLTNEAGLSRKDRVGSVWSRKRKFSKSRIRGRYHGSTRSSRPYIELRVDKILQSLSGISRRIPIAREILFGHVLYHEIGHHIHRTLRPEYHEREDVADNWAGKLNANFIRRKYWYAVPLLLAASKFYKLLKPKRGA